MGTGPGGGVVGYVVSGGLSGYFSRRLGLLGPRVTKLTVVTAAGEIRVLTPDDELFTVMLGADGHPRLPARAAPRASKTCGTKAPQAIRPSGAGGLKTGRYPEKKVF